MQRFDDLKEKIHAVAGDGEILLLVPPFVSLYGTILGPHLLQTLAKEKGYKVDLLYLTVLLAPIIGLEDYERICTAPQYWMLGERLFARSAYGLPVMGRNPDRCTSEAMSLRGDMDLPEVTYESNQNFDLDKYIEMEETCAAFIEETIEIIAGLNYKIIGLACSMNGQAACSMTLINGIKKRSPQTVIIIGGGRCKDEMADGVASLSPNIDYIFSNESEKTFIDFLDGFYAGKRPDTRIIRGKPFMEMDTLPLPDFGIYLDQYQRFIGDTNQDRIRIWFESSRGCWWGEIAKCTFCCEHPTLYKQKSIHRIVNELKKIKETTGDKLIYMTDSIMPYSYLNELFPVLAEEENAPLLPSLTYQLRAILDLKQLMALKKAKVQAVLPGIESFSTYLLKSMSKGVSGSQNLLFLRNAASVGIFASWFLIWGFPGDRVSDYEEQLELLPLISHLQAPLDFSGMRYGRFSPYYNNQEKYGLTNIRSWAVFNDIYPDWADRKNLDSYYAFNFESESIANPDVIRRISAYIAVWQKKWRNTRLAMGRFMDAYVIIDTRDIHENPKTLVVDYLQAQEIMTVHPYNEETASDHLKWALQEKLGVVLDSRYIPIVTAAPELLMEFQEKQANSNTPN